MPRKFGQHFLTSQAILQQLASAACSEHAHRVVEIGPGRGALTRCLLPLTDELHAIEIDPAMLHALEAQFASAPNLHIHHADVLETDLAQWGPAIITGNLPYYITSPIIDKFLGLDANFPSAVFLMQWEVAQRILARAGSRDYGYLTVACQLICGVDLVCKVPPGAFSPPPKVDSAAVRFLRKPEPVPQWREVLLLASRAFAQKRKNLRNNLRPFYGSAIDRLPEATLRAEQLDIAHLIGLYNRLVSYTEAS